MPIETGINRLLDYELQSNKGIANGYAGLDASALLSLTNLPPHNNTYHSTPFLPLAGGELTGNLDFNGAQLHMNDNYLSLGYQTGLQAIDAGGSHYNLTFYDSGNVGGVTLDTLVAGGGSAAWGSITGTLSNQIDLDTALDAKLPKSAGVTEKLTGNLYLELNDAMVRLQDATRTYGSLQGSAISPYSISLYANAATGNLELGTDGASTSLLLRPSTTTVLTLTSTGITAAKPLAMGTNKITGLAAATANGDALRYEQRNGYSMEVADDALGINPADSSTYYFARIGTPAHTTAGQCTSIRRFPVGGKITAAYLTMCCSTAGSAENISAYIRVNNAEDILIQTLGTSASQRNFSSWSLSKVVYTGDYFEIKIVYPAWVTNPTAVTWSGIIVITV